MRCSTRTTSPKSPSSSRCNFTISDVPAGSLPAALLPPDRNCRANGDSEYSYRERQRHYDYQPAGFRSCARYRDAQYGLANHREDPEPPIRPAVVQTVLRTMEFDMAALAQIGLADCPQIIQFGHS